MDIVGREDLLTQNRIREEDVYVLVRVEGKICWFGEGEREGVYGKDSTRGKALSGSSGRRGYVGMKQGEERKRRRI